MSEGESVKRCGLSETNLMYRGTQSKVIGRNTPRKQNRHNLSGPYQNKNYRKESHLCLCQWVLDITFEGVLRGAHLILSNSNWSIV